MAQCMYFKRKPGSIFLYKQRHVLLSGESPDPGVNSREVAGLMQTEYRMPKPSQISQEL